MAGNKGKETKTTANKWQKCNLAVPDSSCVSHWSVGF